MTSVNRSGTNYVNLAWYQRIKDSVPLFDPKVPHFENIVLLKILLCVYQLKMRRLGALARTGVLFIQPNNCAPVHVIVSQVNK